MEKEEEEKIIHARVKWDFNSVNLLYSSAIGVVKWTGILDKVDNLDLQFEYLARTNFKKGAYFSIGIWLFYESNLNGIIIFLLKL